MHEETYPDFFTPRDEEPSHSSSEEKSLEFDWLVLMIQKDVKTLKLATNMIRRHC